MENTPSVTNQFVKDSSWNFLAVAFSKTGGLIFIVLAARFLLPEKFGIYTLAISVAMLVIALTNIGTNQTTLRYVSEAIGKNDKKKAASYYHFMFKTKSVFAFISAIFLLAISYPISSFIFNKPDLFLPILVSCLYLLFTFFQTFYESFFFIFGNVKFLAIKELIFQSSKIIFILLFFFFIGQTASLTIFALAISSAIAVLLLFCFLKHKKTFLFKKSNFPIDKHKIYNFMKYGIFSSVTFTIFSAVDVIILGAFVLSEFIGYYSAAVLIISGFVTPLTFSNILLPIFTKMKSENLNNSFNRVLKYLSILSIPLTFGIVLFSNYILRVIYGYEYLDAVFPMLVLSLLVFETPITENLRALLLAKENQKLVAKIMFIATIINISLNFILIFTLLQISEVMAITGAAIATVLSRMFILFNFVTIAKNKTNTFPNFKFFVKPLFASIGMAVAIIFINRFISDMTLVYGILEILAGMVIYFVLMFLFRGITKKDFGLVKELLK